MKYKKPKRLDQLKKKELIELIERVRPKSDCYDAICRYLGIPNNVLQKLKKLGIEPTSKQ